MSIMTIKQPVISDVTATVLLSIHATPNTSDGDTEIVKDWFPEVSVITIVLLE